MAHTLTTGLSDLGKELGETTVNTGTARVKHYNDAVIDFANEKRWKFLLKKQELTATTTPTGREYAVAPIVDMRENGGIKEIVIGTDADDNPPWTPIEYEDRHDSQLATHKTFYVDEETGKIVLTSDPGTTGEAITVRYYHVPARIEDTNSADTFPIPDRYRKIVSTLAAAYTQWSRYLDAQGNRLFNLYQTMVGKAEYQQAERNKNHPRKLQHYLQWRGFTRRYPGGRFGRGR